jgi:hypothetical protein
MRHNSSPSESRPVDFVLVNIYQCDLFALAQFGSGLCAAHSTELDTQSGSHEITTGSHIVHVSTGF